MKSSRILLASSLAIALVACANKKTNYDTTQPYRASAGEQDQSATQNPNQSVNPTYDSPAAYEDSSATPVAPGTNDTLASRTSTPSATGGAATRTATVHTVVQGDTLGGIARQYKVPMDSIMKANGMTKDTVVLGRKLQIPAH